jgi:azurin
MKYDTTAITAAPGESLRVVFTNAGTIPKDVMGHNWVLLNSGVDASAFASAASAFKDTGYIPTGRSGDIIAKINLLGPRKSGEVVFNAPTKPGVYTFLCTFPAHYLAGMHGTLTVK